MKETVKLANRFREVILNGTWIANTNYKDQLSGIDWESATRKLGSANSIADLAQHIHYYIKGLIAVFKGGRLEIRDVFSFSFPPIESEGEWKNFLSTFWSDAETFALLVEGLPEEKLGHVFADEKYGTYSRNIEGMIEHSYYHLGQIVLIKKLLSV